MLKQPDEKVQEAQVVVLTLKLSEVPLLTPESHETLRNCSY